MNQDNRKYHNYERIGHVRRNNRIKKQKMTIKIL